MFVDIAEPLSQPQLVKFASFLASDPARGKQFGAERQTVPWRLRRPHDAVLRDDRIRPDVIVPVHVLEVVGIRDRSHEMDSEFVEQVWRDLDAPGLGNRRDLAHFRQSAALVVRLQNRRGRRLEERPQVVTGKVAFAADDPGLERCGDTLVAVEILADDRFLQPVDVKVVQVVAGLNSSVGRPAHVDVDHDLDVITQSLPHGL